MTIKTMFLLALTAAIFAIPAYAAPIVIDARLDAYTQQVLIPVRFNDARFWCSLDSGYSASVGLDNAKARSAGIEGPRATLEIGGIVFRDHDIMIRPMAVEAVNTDCIVGVALFRGYVVDMDFAMPTVRLWKPAEYRPPADSQTIPLLFRTNPNVPFVDIVITVVDGTHEEARVVPDTGASFYTAAFKPPFSERIRSRVAVVDTPKPTSDSSRPRLKLTAAQPESLSVGQFTILRPTIALIESGVDSAIDDGLLGCGFFQHYRVSFDFEGRRMYLRRNPD